MPRKNLDRQFVKNGIYHVYNRGVEKRNIFLDDQDYRVYLHLLKFYLSFPEENKVHPFSSLDIVKRIRPRPVDNLSKNIDLLAYCLMPNHFHLLLKLVTIDGLQKLMQRLPTTYAMYFNQRYNRVGYLFQGRYKSILVDKDEYVMHLSRYIHLNPMPLLNMTKPTPVRYPYSSYPYYLKQKQAIWIKPEFVLSYFKGPLSYKRFVESQINSEDVLGKLCID